MKVVLDTNVLVSAFLWNGASAELFSLWREGTIEICVSGEILAEFERVLNYRKLAKHIERVGKTASQIVDEFAQIAESLPSHHFPTTQVHADPSDDMVLACALAARASYIVSGDAHLLKLKTFSDIPIVTPAQLIARTRRK